MFNADYMIYYAITALMSFVGMWVSGKLQSKFKQYSQVRLRSNLTGAQVAQQMLRFYNINDVKIVQGEGYLSDHYNPMSKTVALSPEVFQGISVASAAVAAHECGHAVQHANAYAMLKFRSAMVPVVKVASMASQFLLMAAFMLANTFPSLMLITIIAFAITCAFSIVTLPVEFDASKRALVWLEQSGVTLGEEHEGAKDALKWAAMTYVSAALSALVMLIFLVLRYMGSNRE